MWLYWSVFTFAIAKSVTFHDCYKSYVQNSIHINNILLYVKNVNNWSISIVCANPFEPKCDTVRLFLHWPVFSSVNFSKIEHIELEYIYKTKQKKYTIQQCEIRAEKGRIK